MTRLIVGAVASRFMKTEPEAVPPALVALQTYVVPAVSAVTTIGAQPALLVMPLSGSLTLNEIATLLRYHPLLPSVPSTVGTIIGAVGSTTDSVLVAVVAT